MMHLSIFCLLNLLLVIPQVKAQALRYNLDVSTEKRHTIDYLVYLPHKYPDLPTERWPLLLYLHGGSLRGNDLSLLTKQGLPYLLEHGFDLPFIVVVPQCPPGGDMDGCGRAQGPAG